MSRVDGRSRLAARKQKLGAVGAGLSLESGWPHWRPVAGASGQRAVVTWLLVKNRVTPKWFALVNGNME